MMSSRWHLTVALLYVFNICLAIGAETGITLNGKPEFYVGTEKVTRDEAEHLCQTKCMELVSIEDPSMHSKVIELFKQNSINEALWTSGKQNKDGKTWNWSSGGEIKPSDLSPIVSNPVGSAEINGDSLTSGERNKDGKTWSWSIGGDIKSPKFSQIVSNPVEGAEINGVTWKSGKWYRYGSPCSWTIGGGIKTPDLPPIVSNPVGRAEINRGTWTSGQWNTYGLPCSGGSGGGIKNSDPVPVVSNTVESAGICIAVSFDTHNITLKTQPCGDKSGYICAMSPNQTQEDFYFSKEKVSSAQARKICSTKCMQLIRLHNKEENEALYDLIVRKNGTRTRYWTTGHKGPTGKWLWSNNDAIKYFHWAPNEPNFKKTVLSCIEVFIRNKGLFWNDHYCSEKRNFICENKQDP